MSGIGPGLTQAMARPRGSQWELVSVLVLVSVRVVWGPGSVLVQTLAVTWAPGFAQAWALQWAFGWQLS